MCEWSVESVDFGGETGDKGGEIVAGWCGIGCRNGADGSHFRICSIAETFYSQCNSKAIKMRKTQQKCNDTSFLPTEHASYQFLLNFLISRFALSVPSRLNYRIIQSQVHLECRSHGDTLP